MEGRLEGGNAQAIASPWDFTSLKKYMRHPIECGGELGWLFFILIEYGDLS